MEDIMINDNVINDISCVPEVGRILRGRPRLKSMVKKEARRLAVLGRFPLTNGLWVIREEERHFGVYEELGDYTFRKIRQGFEEDCEGVDFSLEELSAISTGLERYSIAVLNLVGLAISGEKCTPTEELEKAVRGMVHAICYAGSRRETLYSLREIQRIEDGT